MSESRWMEFAKDFGAPMEALRTASERTGVGSEAFLAIATDLRAVRALLDLALRTGTISGYSMGHPVQDVAGGTVQDVEEVWNKEHALTRIAEPNLSDPDETVTP